MKVSSQSDLQNISEADRVHVTEDITITDDFNTISTFSGVFDGNGHTISNLTIPFISEVTDQAKIKNTMFKSSESHIFTENRGKLQSISVANTHIHNTDYSEEEIGILTPKNFGEITDCTVSDSSIKSNFQYMGGIAGRTGDNSQIKLCSVENTSLNKGYIAGAVVGSNFRDSTNVKIADCEISNTDIHGFYVGGIISSIDGSEISNTTVYDSKLYADSDVAGLHCKGFNNHIQNCSIEKTKYLGSSVYMFCKVTSSDLFEEDISKLESSFVRECSISFVVDRRSEKKTAFKVDENSTVSDCFVTKTEVETNKTTNLFSWLKGDIKNSYVNLTLLQSKDKKFKTPEVEHSSFYIDIDTKVEKPDPQTRTITHHDELKEINRYDTVLLNTDLDFSEFEFEPIPLFEGTFDGNGHKISNITDTLFNRFQGTLKNLNIQNIQFNPLESGIIATKIRDSKIKNIDIDMTKQIDSTAQFQSFARIVRESTISDCNINIKYDGTACFGIAESLRKATTIKNCVVNLDVKAEKCAGIAKTTIEPFKKESKIRSCTTSGSIKSTTCTGLILNLDAKMENCKSDVTIITAESSTEEFTTSIGGLVGEHEKSKIQNCEFSGKIKNNAKIDTIGGIVSSSDGTIQNCINNGEISTTKDVKTGGLVGQLKENGIVENSRNIGTITGINTVGGLIGECYGKISNSYNHAKVNSHSENTLIGNKAEDSTLENIYLLPISETQTTTHGTKTNESPKTLNTILGI